MRITFCKTEIRSSPRKNGFGKISNLDFHWSHFFNESQPLYIMYKYRIYLDQIEFFLDAVFVYVQVTFFQHWQIVC